MVLTQEEQHTLNALASNQKNLEVIAKFFIRPFENLPKEFVNVPNESLGEVVKAQLMARESNKLYLAEMKSLVVKNKAEPAPVAPS